MKRIFVFVCLLSATFCFAQNRPPADTAFFYLTNPQSFLGMTVKVRVATAIPTSACPDNDFVCFECQTLAKDGSDGGKIMALVPQWRARQFFEKYYTAPDKLSANAKNAQTLSARFIKYEWDDDNRSYVLSTEE